MVNVPSLTKMKVQNSMKTVAAEMDAQVAMEIPLRKAKSQTAKPSMVKIKSAVSKMEGQKSWKGKSEKINPAKPKVGKSKRSEPEN